MDVVPTFLTILGGVSGVVTIVGFLVSRGSMRERTQ